MTPEAVWLCMQDITRVPMGFWQKPFPPVEQPDALKSSVSPPMGCSPPSINPTLKMQVRARTGDKLQMCPLLRQNHEHPCAGSACTKIATIGNMRKAY